MTPIPRRAVTIVMGDMNAKIGKRSNNDSYPCAWSKAKRNENGEDFLNFCERSNLTITNSLFKYTSRHITTWQGHHRSSDSTESTPIYNQIDYIAISNQYKLLGRVCFAKRSLTGSNGPHNTKEALANEACYQEPSH